MLQRTARTVLLLVALLAGDSSPAQPVDTYADARALFLTAYAATATAPPEQVPVDSDTLKSYPLYPYLQAARLERRLAATVPRAPSAATDALLPVDAEIDSFIRQHANQPVTRDLRRDWLDSLAGRKAWSKLLEQYDPGRDANDVALRCSVFAARIALSRTDGLADSVTETWLSPQSLPDACEPAFTWLRARGRLGNDLVERRARLALGAGAPALARSLARALPPQAAAPLLQWAGLIEQPRARVEALIADPGKPVEDDALIDGWQRFARTDSEAAAADYPALVAARKLDDRRASAYALAVALSKAWSRQPGALEFFARVHPDDFDERAHEWHARAALWAGNWTQAHKAIEAMPEALRNQPRWRYWSARAAQELDDQSAARQAYAALLSTDNWYAVLAAARLGRTFAPTLQPLPIDDAEVTRLAGDPGFVRARELLLCHLTGEAGTEWRAAYDTLAPAQQVQAVGLAARWGWHLQAIASAARQGLFNDYDLLYPRPYDSEVRAASIRTGLPAELIYSIIRQESLYREDAKSRAGALGLMQLLPDTARRTARRWDLPPPTRASLLLPSVNIPLGAATLKSLVDRAAGQVAIAVAAYNAGPSAVRRWLPPDPMDVDVWVENIPFNETRAYVQRVAWHALVYAWLKDRRPRDVGSWLTSVRQPPPDAALGQSR